MHKKLNYMLWVLDYGITITDYSVTKCLTVGGQQSLRNSGK